MLRDATNFYVGTGIVSRLYMGDTMVWPFAYGNFWQFTENSLNKVLSNLNIIYAGGSIVVDWGDGQTNDIISNVNYTHTFGEPSAIPTSTCIECDGSATLVGTSVETVCISVPNLTFNSNDIVPINFDCNYNLSTSYMQYPTSSSCGSATFGSQFVTPCGSATNIGKVYYKAILAGGGERNITPGLTFAQCGINQGIHSYYAILCPNSCAQIEWDPFGTIQAIKTKSYPSQLWIN